MKILRMILSAIRMIPSLFWIGVVLPLVAAYRAWKSGNKTTAHEMWSRSVNDYLKVQYIRLGNRSITQEENIVFLCNHRTQADFFTTDPITNYKANALGRQQVIFAFPCSWFINYGTIWFFDRSNVQIDKFNKWLDEKFEKSPRSCLALFPEGHRMYRAREAGVVKTGMIKYSYMRKKKVQIVISFGNEDVFNEKQVILNFGRKIYYWVSELIDPADYPTIQGFVKHVTERFRQFFAENYKIYEQKLQQSIKESAKA